MSPDLARRVLALPDNVRRRLARCEGPGWHINRGTGPTPVVEAKGRRPYADIPLLPSEAWLPASEAAVLEVAAEIAGATDVLLSLSVTAPPEMRFGAEARFVLQDTHRAYAATAMDAAFALLEAVVAGRPT